MGIVTNMNDKYQNCIAACQRCAQACMECMMLCLNEEDVKNRRKCIGTLLECSSICEKAACFMAFDAQFAKEMCLLCAAICERCAKECSMFKDDHCIKCENMCKACYDECMKMARV